MMADENPIDLSAQSTNKPKEKRMTEVDMQKVKAEMLELREKVLHIKTVFGELRDDINDLLNERKRILSLLSPDSGMSSLECKKKKKTQNYSKCDTECTLSGCESRKKIESTTGTKRGKRTNNVSEGNTSAVKIKEEVEETVLRYGVIRHNANKMHQSNVTNEAASTAYGVLKTKDTNLRTISPEYTHKKKRALKGSDTTIQGDENLMVPIGSGKTLVPRTLMNTINWNSYTIATRKLLMAVFNRSILATHSLTGKPSPAFANKPAKLCLDQKKVADIIITVSEKCKVKENLVRNAITTKCADENKMMRLHAKKKNATL